MAKLLCSVLSGPALSEERTYFNKPVNMQYVRSVAVGTHQEGGNMLYIIDFEGADVRWLFDTAEELETVYGHIINHEF